MKPILYLILTGVLFADAPKIDDTHQAKYWRLVARQAMARVAHDEAIKKAEADLKAEMQAVQTEALALLESAKKTSGCAGIIAAGKDGLECQPQPTKPVKP